MSKLEPRTPSPRARLGVVRLLVIESAAETIGALHAHLEPLGYTLQVARDGVSALTLAAGDGYDAIVLDSVVGGISGIDLCRRLREELGLTAPIVILATGNNVDDRVRALRAGADDCLGKSFSFDELAARLTALIRRSQGRTLDI